MHQQRPNDDGLKIDFGVVRINGQGLNAFTFRPCYNPAPTYFRLATIIGPIGLTSEFGMGSGVTQPVWAPRKFNTLLSSVKIVPQWGRAQTSALYFCVNKPLKARSQQHIGKERR